MCKILTPKTILLFGNKMNLDGNVVYINCGGFLKSQKAKERKEKENLKKS